MVSELIIRKTWYCFFELIALGHSLKAHIPQFHSFPYPSPFLAPVVRALLTLLQTHIYHTTSTSLIQCAIVHIFDLNAAITSGNILLFHFVTNKVI